MGLITEFAYRILGNIIVLELFRSEYDYVKKIDQTMSKADWEARLREVEQTVRLQQTIRLWKLPQNLGLAESPDVHCLSNKSKSRS